MNERLYAVKKDSVIVACKKRAKEILKNQESTGLTLMQCLDLAAKEMKFNHWYELRNHRKNTITIDASKEKVNPAYLWDNLIIEYFKQEYETLHFEIRNKMVEIKGRKYGLIETIVEPCSENMIYEALLYLNIDIDNYGWLSKPTYNIQTMPVYSVKKEIKNYDVIVVKRDEFEIKKSIQKQNQVKKEKTFLEQLKYLGFNDNNVKDIQEKFGHKNIFISGVTGSGKSKTAEIIVNSLKEKHFHVVDIETVGDINDLEKVMLQITNSQVDYIFLPEIRQEHMVSWLNKIIQQGYKVITTIHSNSIDSIYSRLKSLGFTQFDDNDNMTNNLFIYQEMVALLCNECKEKQFSFKKVVKNTAFMNYINKFEKHEYAENNMYKRSNNTVCKNPKCHHGLQGRKIIAETYNIYEDNNNNYYKNIENHNRYLNYNLLSMNEKIKMSPVVRLREGKVSEYLKTKSSDCQSNKFAMVLNGEVEL